MRTIRLTKPTKSDGRLVVSGGRRNGARTDDLVVELEFADGPLQGRRVTWLASTAELYFAGFSESDLPLLGHARPGRDALGIYRFERAYDCARTLERVYVFRWLSAPYRDRNNSEITANE